MDGLPACHGGWAVAEGEAKMWRRGMRGRGAMTPTWSGRRLPLAALVALALLMVLAMFAVSCGEEEITQSDLLLASTTSTQDSGLFDELIPAFEAAYPQYLVKVTAVGSGEAIALGQNKDADVLLVHSPAAEKTFMDEGFGTERKDVMYNDFVIVGPASDPEGIKGMATAAEAFTKISKGATSFFSRADKSGTNAKELVIWKAAGIEPSGAWYLELGQGMGETLRVTNEKLGYTLSDRATYLSAKESLDLEILVEGDPVLYNQYGVIIVTDAKNEQGAKDFLTWITSTEGQEAIANFGVEKFGQALFIPNAE
jgi:tungstate transport system substrate-binding protein